MSEGHIWLELIVIIILVVMGSPVVKEAFDRYLKKFREKRETLAGKEAA